MAGDGHDCWRARAGSRRAHHLANSLQFSSRGVTRNFAFLVLFLYHFVDLCRRRIGHLHRAAADKCAAASASTKFR